MRIGFEDGVQSRPLPATTFRCDRSTARQLGVGAHRWLASCYLLGMMGYVDRLGAACLGILAAGCGVSASEGLESHQVDGAFGLQPAPLANQIVLTQHPSAYGPLWWHVHERKPLDSIVVTPDEQIASGKEAFTIGPSSYMVDYEGKVNDIASMAKLVEFATPGLELHDAVYNMLHGELMTRILSEQGFQMTRDWEPNSAEPQDAEPQDYALGWWPDFQAGAELPRADLRREIYVRLPDRSKTSGISRQNVIEEIARINYRYLKFLQADLYGADGPECGEALKAQKPSLSAHNAIVRLIEPQAKEGEAGRAQIREINESYDEAFAKVAQLYQQKDHLEEPAFVYHRGDAILPLYPVQGVALLEDPQTIVEGTYWVEDYITYYQSRYGDTPPSVILFVAGSDLNRIAGPVAGELLRSVMISRMHRLQKKYPKIQLMVWLGSGGGPIRSGPGRVVTRDGADPVFVEYTGTRKPTHS